MATHSSHSKVAVGPLGEAMTRDSLPAPTTTRWVARRKAEVVAAVHGGLYSVDEICRRYNITLEEFAGWQRAVERSGMKGLQVTRAQARRGRVHRELAVGAGVIVSGDNDAIEPDAAPRDQAGDDAGVPDMAVIDGDRRNSPRLALLLRVAKLIVDGREQFCIIRDATTKGIKVKLFAPLSDFRTLAVELADGERYPARCVWMADNNAGLEFLEPVALESLIDHARHAGRRRHLRLRLALTGHLHLGETTAEVRFHDISQHGAAFKTDKWLLIDELVRIETNVFPSIYAKVRWRNHPHYGVCFEQTFQLDDLATRCDIAQVRA
jgi:transposase-like protein